MREMKIEVCARFSFKTSLEVPEDEEGLTAEEQDELEDAVMRALASFSFRGVNISNEDPPAIDIEVEDV